MPPRTPTKPINPAALALAAAILLPAHFAAAQMPSPPPWPFASPSPTPGAMPGTIPFTPPPEPRRDIPVTEKAWADLSNQEVGDYGQKALAIKPQDWKHAETDNFILHFRGITDARQVAREIEYDLWFVAKELGAAPAQYNRHKSHVFIFKDETEWDNFLAETREPLWAASFAMRDELFLNIRSNGNGAPFDSHLLAHETTHAVVSRLYPFEHWPVWLNEGFAEYMGGACVAARNHEPVKNNQKNLAYADLGLDDLFAVKIYPTEQDKVDQLYQTSEKFVRYLMNDLPKERFRQYVTEVLKTNDGKQAFMTVYGDKFKDFDAFAKKFKDFSK
ncbi:MAG TPA: hypothetical protein VG733_03615 [Chthoniobacteraceae bacterium]|nr:hypothetical protein [Chthoniobacteraceae bacterium]